MSPAVEDSRDRPARFKRKFMPSLCAIHLGFGLGAAHIAACERRWKQSLSGRGEWIRTTGLYVPNVAR